MKISVVMATYQGERFIREQLESIRKQSFPVDEVIICDDCSKDQTVQRVLEYIEEYHLEDTYHCYVNEKNIGYASNFIGAADRATGDILFFCDQDDIWIEDRVARMVHLMEEHSDMELLGSEFLRFSMGNDAPNVPGWEMKMMRFDESLEHLSYEPKNIPIGCQGCTMCLRRSFYERIRPFWYEGWAHDEFVWKMALCDGALYLYHSATLKRRLHENNVTMHKMRDRKKRIRFIEDLCKTHMATMRYVDEVTKDEKQKKLLQKNYEGCKLRLKVLKDRKVFYTIPLILRYQVCYHKRRTIFVECFMAIKG